MYSKWQHLKITHIKETFLCPRIESSRAYCVFPVHLFICLSVCFSVVNIRHNLWCTFKWYHCQWPCSHYFYLWAKSGSSKLCRGPTHTHVFLIFLFSIVKDSHLEKFVYLWHWIHVIHNYRFIFNIIFLFLVIGWIVQLYYYLIIW